MPLKRLAKLGKVEMEAKGKVTPFDIVMENIKTRRSVRKYLKKDIPIELVYKLIDAARYAPSSGNNQCWAFIVVKDKKMKKELAEAANQDWVSEAPVIVVACINMQIASAVYGERGAKLYGIQNVAAAIENLLLTANSLGLGTCWVGAFSEPRVSILLECPDYIRPCALVTVGWPDEAPKAPPRHEVSEIVHLEKYGKTPRAMFAYGVE